MPGAARELNNEEGAGNGAFFFSACLVGRRSDPMQRP